MYKIYGIPNCDKVKLVLKALKKSGTEFEFVDFKKSAPTASDIKRWKEFLGELPVNKRGTTFRKIKADFEAATQAQQIKLLIEHTSSIKRPILEKANKVLGIGYDQIIGQL